MMTKEPREILNETPTAPLCRIYGIKNCDSMKKAFAWLNERGVPYTFHDYKKQGVPQDRLVRWCQTLGWKTLLNTKGTTWRKLTPEQQDIKTQSQAVALMMEHPSVIRRPLVELAGDPVGGPVGQSLLVGFDPTIFESSIR